jgi:hypothetical protein
MKYVSQNSYFRSISEDNLRHMIEGEFGLRDASSEKKD